MSNQLYFCLVGIQEYSKGFVFAAVTKSDNGYKVEIVLNLFLIQEFENFSSNGLQGLSITLRSIDYAA